MNSSSSFDWAVLKRRIAETEAAAASRDEDRLEALLQRRAQQLRSRATDPASAALAGLPVLTARAGREWLALPLAQLADAIPGASITPVPGWPPGVLGVVNRRGSIQPVLDLRPLLQPTAPAGGPASGGIVLFLRSASRSYGLLVEEAGDLRSIDPAAFTLPGSHPAASPLVVGSDATGLVLLDLARLDGLDLFGPAGPVHAPPAP